MTSPVLPPSQQRIFFSYAAVDRNLIRPLVKAVTDTGARVHLEEWTSSGSGGEPPLSDGPWDGVLVVSPAALLDQRILNGFGRYLQGAGDRRRVPILVGTVPEVPSFLVGFAWVDFRSRLSRSFQDALEELFDLLVASDGDN